LAGNKAREKVSLQLSSMLYWELSGHFLSAYFYIDEKAIWHWRKLVQRRIKNSEETGKTSGVR
jgi:hypothetical protein